MPSIGNCRRIDIHPIGVEGAFSLPIASEALVFVAQNVAQVHAILRAFQGLPGVVRDKMNDLRRDYRCTNPNCRNVRTELDGQSLTLKLIHSERRGNVWHAHYRLEANVHVMCRPGGPNDKPGLPKEERDPEQRTEDSPEGSDTSSESSSSDPWALGGAADELAASITDALLSGGKPDCDC